MCDASKTRHTSAGRPALYCSLPVPRPPSAIPPHHPPASIFSVHDHSGCECRSSDPRSALPQLLQVRAGGVALLTASESFGHGRTSAGVRAVIARLFSVDGFSAGVGAASRPTTHKIETH